MLVGVDDASADVRSHRIRSDDHKWTCVRRTRQRAIPEAIQILLQLTWQYLRPYGTRSSITKSTTDIIACKEKPSDYCKMFVLCCSLDWRLSWIWKETASKTKNDLCPNDSGLT